MKSSISNSLAVQRSGDIYEQNYDTTKSALEHGSFIPESKKFSRIRLVQHVKTFLFYEFVL